MNTTTGVSVLCCAELPATAMLALLVFVLCAVSAVLPPTRVSATVTSCANGETDPCCHLNQYWSSSDDIDYQLVRMYSAGSGVAPPCSPSEQASFDRTYQLMMLPNTTCWGSATDYGGIWTTAPTLCKAIASTVFHGCTVNLAGNTPHCETVLSSTAAIAAVSSSTANSIHPLHTTASSSTAGMLNHCTHIASPTLLATLACLIAALLA